MSSGLIDVIHIGLDIQEDMVGANEGLLESTEKGTIQRVISEAVGGNRRKAAEILGISLRTLQYRIKSMVLPRMQGLRLQVQKMHIPRISVRACSRDKFIISNNNKSL